MSQKSGSQHKYPHTQAANRYAQDAISGHVDVCRFVRLAAERHLNDLERQKDEDFPYYFDPKGTDDLCAFIELMQHTRGEWTGKRITLEPWQKFTFGIPFGWKKKKDGKRRYREMYVEVPRKNGKSIMGAGIGNYMLTADGELGAEVFSGASGERQAWEVFGTARLMALHNGDYREAFGLHVGAKNISILDTASRFEAVIGRPGDGSSPHCALVDEFHEHSGPDLYDTMKTGMGARSQPMLVCITTAGTDTSGPCYTKRSEGIKLLEGALDNPAWWVVIYTIDMDDDWTDFAVWRKANPNLEISLYEDDLLSAYTTAMQTASEQNIIKCKRLNVWSSAAVGWINMAKWGLCADPALKMDDFKGQPCWVGVDLASKVDLTAMMFLFKVRPESDFARFLKADYVLFGKYYLPEETIERPENSRYRQWRDMGLLTSTPGARTAFCPP